MKSIAQKLTGRIIVVRCPRKLKKYLKKHTYMAYREMPAVDAFNFQLRNSNSPFLQHKQFYKSL